MTAEYPLFPDASRAGHFEMEIFCCFTAGLPHSRCESMRVAQQEPAVRHCSMRLCAHIQICQRRVPLADVSGTTISCGCTAFAPPSALLGTTHAHTHTQMSMRATTRGDKQAYT